MGTEHVIDSYVHNGRIAVLVELTAESDYATRTDQFKGIAKDIAMHIAAAAPESIASLLEQPFVKEPSRTVRQLLADVSSSLRESIAVTRFVRWDTNPSVQPAEPDPPKSPAIAMRTQRRA